MINGIKHIAFIMDGNGRWAKKRLMPREFGHKAGAEKFKEILNYCKNIDIDIVTVYAFSTENWKRPQKEVDALMRLLDAYLDEVKGSIDNNDIKYHFIGDISVLNEKLRKKIEEIENKSALKKYIVNVAFNFGSKSCIKLFTSFCGRFQFSVEKA